MKLEWLLYTILVIPAYGMALKIFFAMIAEGGALDVVFGWRKMLDNLYGGGKVKRLIGKALGDCQQCTSFWMAVPWFFLYVKFSYLLFDYYPTQNFGWFWTITLHVFWFVVMQAILATIGFAILMLKLKRDKKSKT
jgi:hypothetical protein